MTHKTPKPHLMLLPREIRDSIYEYLFPLAKDITTLKPNYNHEGNVQYVEGRLRLRRDGVSCYTAILRVNKQIHAEASRTLYGRTFTLTLTAKKYEFLWTSCGDILGLFPKYFPFSAISALRIHVAAPPKRYRNKHWILFREQFHKLSMALSMLTLESGVSLKRLIIDASEPWDLDGLRSEQCEAIRYICRLFSQSRWTLQNVVDCEMRLGGLAGLSLDTTKLAKGGDRVFKRGKRTESAIQAVRLLEW